MCDVGQRHRFKLSRMKPRDDVCLGHARPPSMQGRNHKATVNDLTNRSRITRPCCAWHRFIGQMCQPALDAQAARPQTPGRCARFDHRVRAGPPGQKRAYRSTPAASTYRAIACEPLCGVGVTRSRVMDAEPRAQGHPSMGVGLAARRHGGRCRATMLIARYGDHSRLAMGRRGAGAGAARFRSGPHSHHRLRPSSPASLHIHPHPCMCPDAERSVGQRSGAAVLARAGLPWADWWLGL